MNDEIEFYINENGIACVTLDLYNDSLEAIERLNKIKKLDIDYNKYLTNEIIKLDNIIKEIRELVNKEDFTMKQKYEMRESILEILDKENK